MSDDDFTRPATDAAAPAGRVASGDSSVSRADPGGVGGEAQSALADQARFDTGAISTIGDVQAAPGFETLTKATAVTSQFPSLNGQPAVEIAERSADVTKSATKRHVKIFRVFHGRNPFVLDSFDHAPNINATRQYMLDHGLRPVGDVRFVGSEDYDDRNVDLTYDVEALPAVVATSPEVAHTIVAQD